jgi:hypothetical protein
MSREALQPDSFSKGKSRQLSRLKRAVGTVTAPILAAVTTTQVIRRGEDEGVSLQIVVNTFDQLRRSACISRSPLLFFSDPR